MVMTEPKRGVRMPREAGNRSHDLCTDYALKKSSRRVKTALWIGDITLPPHCFTPVYSSQWCDQAIAWSVVTYMLGLGLISSGLS